MELNSVKGLTGKIVVSFTKKIIRRGEKSIANRTADRKLDNAADLAVSDKKFDYLTGFN